MYLGLVNAVDDVRPLKRQCSFHRLQHKANLQRLIHLPIDDESRIPVDDGKQIHPPVLHSDVGNVNRPHLIRLRNVKLAQQIGIDPVLQVSLTQIRAGIDGHDPHLSHIAPNGVFVNLIAFPIHNRSNLFVPQKRVLGIQFIDPALEAYLLRGGRDRLVVKGASIQAEEIGMQGNRQLAILPFQKCKSFFTRPIRGQIFF